jgi:hypothetical protein
MKKILFTVCWVVFLLGCFFFPHDKNILLQKFSSAKLKEDFTVFRKVLEAGHPSLYTYTTKEEMNGCFDSVYNTLTNPESLRSFNDKLAFIIAKIGCTHTNIYMPKPYYDTLLGRSIFFPVPLLYVDGGLYVNSDMFKIPVGAHIISINGNSADDIMTRIENYNVPDGKNKTYSLSQAAENFAYDYFLAYGGSANFDVEYAGPESTINKKESIVATTLQKNLTDYNYYAYYYYPSEVGYDFEIIDSLHTAILTIRSFSYATATTFAAYKNFLTNSFALLKNESDINHLIIDCRNNTGGEYENIFLLYRFLSANSFKEIDSAIVKFDKIPYPQFLEKEYTQTEKPYVETMIARDFCRLPNNTNINKAEDNTLRRPHPLAFNGNVYVITNSNVVSAASNFVAMIKDTQRGFTVGEETGGGYNSHNGFSRILYKLPHTNMQLEYSAVRVKHYLFHPQLNKYGIQPDFEVSTTLDDMINNKDPQIEYVINTLIDSVGNTVANK